MNDKEIIIIFDKAILEIENYIKKYNLPENNSLKSDTIKILQLLKTELISNKDNINERLLRGYKDISSTIAIHFEETSFNDPIFEIYHYFNDNIPSFKNLELLRSDFGKGNPI